MQKASHIARQNSQDHISPEFIPSVNMKRRTLSGSCGVGFFVLAFGFIAIAFATPSWLVSDYRITGAKLERLGLWVHCFRSLPDVNDDSQRRFFVGCRWVYDPFTTGYDEIRGFLLPGFMIATQFFFTLAFVGMLISAIGVLVFFLCAGPDQKHFVKLIRAIGCTVLGAGVCASLAVIIFASLGNRNNWMPEHANNWFGWSFVLACVGAVTALVAGSLFLTECYVQKRKRTLFKESQTRFEMMHGGK
ncbi:claudin family member sinuous [Musca autumnalis]|uniref:claudin family member sinuous n=1 Tax=Musca autumnalis TaxID=221902 RepID=UPI003CF0BFD6